MEIKEALLGSEKKRIELFLNLNDLLFDKLISKTFYIEDSDKVIGTISVYNNVIKCFAVSSSYRDENLGGTLISFIVNYFYQNNINHFMVYTKVMYENLFSSLGFHSIVKTDKVVLLESGMPLIVDYIKDLKRKIAYRFQIDMEKDNDIASVVVNCNPVTLGQIELIEQMAKEHKYVIVFILEEDLSYFTYKERMALLNISTTFLPNVVVVPSSEYIISSSTFPNYFLKN